MKITHWTIKISWSNGKQEYISDIPDWVANPVDDYLTSLEKFYKDEIDDDDFFLILKEKKENKDGS